MGTKIKTFRDGSYLEYDQGSFDGWCVYLTQPDGSRRPPKDTDYFSDLQVLAGRYGVQRVYADYVQVYGRTGKEPQKTALDAISSIAAGYGADDLMVDRMFSILYTTMISEERKQYTRLGKRIKRLGIHVLLFEGQSISEAASFMCGMGWREIDRLCRERGF